MRAFSIAWKDFRHTYRNAAAIAMMLVAPLILAVALGAAFGSGDNFSVPAVPTVVVDQDRAGSGASSDAETPAGERAGARIVAVVTSPELSDLLRVTIVETPQAARAAVDEGEADAAVMIPAGLTESLRGQAAAERAGARATDGAATGAGAAATAAVASEVIIYKDPAVSIGPAIVTSVVESVTQALEGARAAALTAAETALAAGVIDGAKLGELATAAAGAYGQATEGPAAVALTERGPVLPGEEGRPNPNVASQVLVGMMIFFMLFGAATPARSILDEHRGGTLFRLFSTPTRRSVILGGKYVGVFLVVLLQSVILLLAGWLLLGARWGAIGPVGLLTLCGAMVAASLGLLTVSFAKTPAQAGAVSSAIFVFLALIGGNFVGTANVTGGFALARRFTPNGWLLEGWGDLLYGGSWGSIALPVLASIAFSAVFFAAATWFFSRRYA